MEGSAKIYSLKEPNSEIVRYIGITTKTLRRRHLGHIATAIAHKGKNHRVNWINSLRLNGLIPDIELIEDGLTFEEAKQKEIEYIKLFKACGARLVNTTMGGDGSLGYHIPQTAKNNLSRSLKLMGIKRGNTSVETRKKISDRLKIFYNANSSKSTKPILQYDLNGNFIKEWKSAREASKYLKISRVQLSRVCTGKIKTSGGFKWKFKNNN